MKERKVHLILKLKSLVHTVLFDFGIERTEEGTHKLRQGKLLSRSFSQEAFNCLIKNWIMIHCRRRRFVAS